MDHLCDVSMAGTGGFAVKAYQGIAKPDAVHDARPIGGAGKTTIEKQMCECAEAIKMAVEASQADRTEVEPNWAEGN